MQARPQKKVARAYRIDGSLVLYRSAARSLFKPERGFSGTKSVWNIVFGVPLFLRTLFRLVFLCPHRHQGPPITLRESIPTLDGRGAYVTCLDCGQKFAYNHKTGRLADFWGVHDAEAQARVRRRVDGFLSTLRGLAARVGRLNMGIPKSEPVSSVHHLGILAKGH